MEFKVLDYNQIKVLLNDESTDNFAVISLTNSNLPSILSSLKSSSSWLVLPVDIANEDDPLQSGSLRLFNKVYADLIKSFIDKNQSIVNYFVIHCDTGERSSAIAAALSTVFNSENKVNYFKDKVMNRTVYRLMIEAYRMPEANENEDF